MPWSIEYIELLDKGFWILKYGSCYFRKTGLELLVHSAVIIVDEQSRYSGAASQDIVNYAITIKIMCKFLKLSTVFEPKLVLFPTAW